MPCSVGSRPGWTRRTGVWTPSRPTSPSRAAGSCTRVIADRTEDPAELTLCTRAADLHRALGDTRGAAEALLWVALWHQVVRGDHATAAPLLTESDTLARRRGDRLTESYALRHRAFVEQAGGRAARARERRRERARLGRRGPIAAVGTFVACGY